LSTVKHTFVVSGMHCNSCAISIDWELEDVEGVACARTNYPKGRTEVTFDPSRVSPQDILDVITRAGFTAAPA
jgi:copper chaperone